MVYVIYYRTTVNKQEMINILVPFHKSIQAQFCSCPKVHEYFLLACLESSQGEVVKQSTKNANFLNKHVEGCIYQQPQGL